MAIKLPFFWIALAATVALGSGVSPAASATVTCCQSCSPVPVCEPRGIAGGNNPNHDPVQGTVGECITQDFFAYKNVTGCYEISIRSTLQKEQEEAPSIAQGARRRLGQQPQPQPLPLTRTFTDKKEAVEAACAHLRASQKEKCRVEVAMAMGDGSTQFDWLVRVLIGAFFVICYYSK